MDSTVSVSKGVFVFKNSLRSAKKQKKRVRKKAIPEGNGNIFSEEIWYQSYNWLWKSIEKNIQNLNNDMFACILSNLVSFIKNTYKSPVSEIPAAILLTGINMPDHAAQFSALAKEVKHQVSPHVVILNAQDCQTLKSLVENMIMQIIGNDNSSDDEEDDNNETNTKKNKLKKSQCNFSLLQYWYEDLYCGKFDKVITVIIPDFESFNETILQDFIQIASSYLNMIPFVMVFGVATSLSALHKALPYQVSSKVNIQVFNSQPSATYLNNVLENVFFSDECPFHLGGKLFTLFTDIFLFYDFSVTGFIQNIKYAILEHFSTGNAKALCVKAEKLTYILDQFEHDDFENVRRMLSFRKLVESESYENQIKLLEDDAFLRSSLELHIQLMHKSLNMMHVLLKCLHILVTDLPKTPLGKQVRELYVMATTTTLTKSSEFKEAFQLLGFLSRDELISKLQKLSELLLIQVKLKDTNKIVFKGILDELHALKLEIEVATLDYDMSVDEDEHDVISDSNMDRQKLKQKLLQMSKQSQPLNRYEKCRLKVINYLEEIFQVHFPQPMMMAFHEVFFFNDMNVQNYIIGSHRSTIHTALNDPNCYLQCDCCEMPNDTSILSTMPDICIAYKLHLEYGKMINLYDWLQAFLSILDPIHADDEDEKREVNPQMQARFTQSVAELEFLGFIKSSKRKADHVARLTWGG